MFRFLKGFAIVLMLIMLVSATSFAASASVFKIENASPFTSIMSLVSTSTGSDGAPGAGTVTSIPVPMSNFSCSLLYSGVSPSTSTITLEGSLDNTLWRSLSSGITTTLETGQFFDVTGKWAAYIRPNWSVFTRATSTYTTTATMKCVAQH